MTPTQTDKLPPHDLNAESAVLGSILIDVEAMRRVDLIPADFYREKHQWAFDCCCDLRDKNVPINQITVAHELATRGLLDSFGGSSYLSSLIADTPTSVHVEYYADIVKKLATKRKLIVAFSKAIDNSYDGTEPEDVVKMAGDLAEKVIKDRVKSNIITPSEWVGMAEERYKSLRTKPSAEFKFGIPWLDSKTGGAHKGRFITVGARPGVGKTTLLMQFAVYAGIAGHVLFASAEESREDIEDRLVASAVGIPITTVNSGEYSDSDYRLIEEGVKIIGERGIYLFSEGGMTTARIWRTAKKAKERHGLKAIFVDYLQLLRDRYGGNSNERVTYISGELKTMARDLGVPVVVACQLNRATEHGDKIPKLHELRDSGSIEQDSDLVLFLYRADAYVDFKDDGCPPGQAKLYIAKQRHGGFIGRHGLLWDGTSQQYKDLDTRYE